MSDVLKVSGKVSIVKYSAEGKELLRKEGSNLVVDAGLALIASRMADAVDSVPNYVAVGDSATATLASMTALQGTEHDRQAATSAHAGATVTYTSTIGAGISSLVTVNEIGLFNAAVASSMLARFLTTEFTLNTGETLLVAWTLTFED